jgi:hypothetical protein
MSRQIQIRRGSAAENDAFTGAIGEVTMDTTNKTLRVHDGTTAGGTTLAKQSEIPDLTNVDYVVESQLPTAENNYTWYRKYKSGWVEQGGKGTTSISIVLPIPMADDNYFILFGNNNYSANAGTPVVVWYDKTSSGFKLQGRWNGSATSGIGACWEVKGIAAE